MPLTKDQYSYWIRACARGNMDALEKMAQGEPWPDLQSQIPKTSCLLLAAANGHRQVCEKLLAGQANLEAVNDEGLTPLLWATILDQEDIVDLLLEAGANVQAKDPGGKTALIWACTENASLAKKLLTHTPDNQVDHKDGEGMSALVASCEVDDISIMQALLEKGANPNQRYENNETTVLGQAVSMKKHEHAARLIAHGARVNRKIDGHTYLHLAVVGQDAQMVRVLLENGAKPELANVSGLTAGQAAQMQGWKEYDQVLSDYQHAALNATTTRARGQRRALRL